MCLVSEEVREHLVKKTFATLKLIEQKREKEVFYVLKYPIILVSNKHLSF
jgi:hypothetical protein